MRPTKLVLFIASLAALAVTFCATYVDLGDGGRFTLWQLRAVHPIAWLVLIGAGASAAVGGIAIATRRLSRGWASLACVCSGLTLAAIVMMSRHLHGDLAGAIGMKLLAGALALGTCAALAGVVKPERVA